MSRPTMPTASRLPRNWKSHVRSSVLRALALAHYVVIQAQGKAVRSRQARSQATIQRLQAEIALLREELRIKDARLALIPPHRRPHYPAVERMAILELRAARGWTLIKTAETFFVTAATIREWLRRLDETGFYQLVQLREPVNKFPEYVAYLIRELKTLCPVLGKQKIAETLARAGLHLGATTVARMLHKSHQPAPVEPGRPHQEHRVRAQRPNHVWHCDLSIVPLVSGFWTPWWPFSFPQCFPFCWWIAVVVDQYSRRVLGVGTFFKQPTSEQVRALLGRAIHQAGATPRHLVCDRGKQFDAHGFRRWCSRRRIQVRYGAVGKHGSIAVVERFIRTLKESLRRLVLLPLRREAFRRELQFIAEWYNEFRPHSGLNGKTPNEVYYRRFPACRKPRYESRKKWPRGSPCAGPWALVRGKPGVKLELQVEYLAGRKHLPIATLKRAA
jgi:putative transposase